MLSGLENPVHLLIVLGVILLLFGAKRLPEMGRSLGSGMREFKSGLLDAPPAQVASQAKPSQTPPPAEVETPTQGYTKNDV
jgi:sec-independent protein translocase protein TatA